MSQLAWISPQFIKTGQAQRPDLSQYVVYGIHIAAGSSEGKPRAWVVNADGTNGGEITIPAEGGKADSVSCEVLPSGGVRFVVSRAQAPGASGSTAVPFASVVPGVFPPAPAQSEGSGAGIVPPGGFIRIKSVTLNDPPWKGEEVIRLADIPAIPATVRRVKLKLCAASDAPKARARVGPDTSGSGALMVNIECPGGGIRVYAEGDRTLTAQRTITLRVENGEVCEYFADIIEMWE